MSDKVAALRALALAHASKLHSQMIILDDTLKAEVDDAQQAAQILTNQIAEMRIKGDLPAVEPRQPDSLADEPVQVKPQADIERMLEVAQQVAADAQQEAIDKGVVLVLQFKRLAPAEYQVIIDKAERDARKTAKGEGATVDENEEFLRLTRDRLLERCYVRTETPDGEDLGFTLNDLLNGDNGAILTHADRANLGQFCISINRTGQAIPFHPAPSGQPATS